MKNKTRKTILTILLCIICTAMAAGIAVVASVLIGDGCSCSCNDKTQEDPDDGNWTDYY